MLRGFAPETLRAHSAGTRIARRAVETIQKSRGYAPGFAASFAIRMACQDAISAAFDPHRAPALRTGNRSEEHTSELQSQSNLVCRLLLEKKKHEIDECHDPSAIV